MKALGHDPATRYLDVYLNGEKLEHCFEADDEAGYVVVARLNESGRPMELLDDGKSSRLGWGDIAVEVRTGRVELRSSQ